MREKTGNKDRKFVISNSRILRLGDGDKGVCNVNTLIG